jgi:uncharacterized protein (DUF1800 family)
MNVFRRPALRLVSGIGLLCVSVASFRAQAVDPFEQPLPRERQIVHVLNRLAFGPRPRAVDEVRRIGAEAWIRMQLNPERIPRSAALELRLRPLASAQMPTWQLFEAYQQPAPANAPRPRLEQFLRAEEVETLQKGTTDERRAILGTLAGERRSQVLLVLPSASMNGLPEVQVEAFNARQAESARQRKLRPPLMELITQDQLGTLLRGTDDEKTALLTGFDPEKRAHVLRQVPPLAMPPAFRREAMKLGQSGQLPLVELIDAKVFRALYSTRQLEEVLVDFWLNHFNVFSGKGPVRMLLTSYERDAIRPYVFGRFRDMVLATARHPAMLFYLDNWQSQAPRSDPPPPAAAEPQRPVGLNENYGRELMELHTLGVDGGYTQSDVVNVARAFTGWTIHEPTRYGEFHFNPAMHDRGEKIVLGHTIPRGGGEQDGVDVIDILSRHPSTAKFVARRLAQRFVADAPPQSVVDRVAAVFLKTDGDLRAVTEALLLSKEFMSEGAWQSKLKSPFELAMSALRAVGADVTDTIVLAQRIGELGQPLYGKSEPTGYANTSEPWASSASVVGRINFAAALLSGQIAGVTIDPRAWPADRRRLAVQILGADAPSSLWAGAPPGAHTPAAAELAAVLLASPAFQKR